MYKLILRRLFCGPSGCFSILSEENGTTVAMIGEHSYEQPDGSWKPKVSPGIYKCVLGAHRLHGMEHDFITYEVTGVEGHTGILFHSGNFPQIDSDGCLLVGQSIGKIEKDGVKLDAVCNSKPTLQKFIADQEHASGATFQLVVLEN